MHLKSKRILLTGGTAGVGRQLVDLLAADNVLVVIGRSAEKLAKLKEAYPSITTRCCDLSQREAVAATVQRLAAMESGFDVLICNAAVQHEPWITAEAFDAATIDREVMTNFTSICELVAVLGPRMARGGVVTLINSGLALAPKASSAVYCATKAALRSFGRSIVYQLEDRGVRVSQIYLPLVDTAMTAGRGRGKIDARCAAEQIVLAITAERAEHYVGQVKVLRWLHRWVPNLAYRIMRSK